jgi:hypothetical protein
VRPATLDALATALDVSVDYLLGRASSAEEPALLKHRLLVYTTSEEFLAAVLPGFIEGVARGDPVLAVTSRDNGRALRREVGKAGGKLRVADPVRWYDSLTAALASYRSFIDEKLDAGASTIRILGEPVWTNPTAAEIDGWNRYEALVNVALAGASAEIICAYNAATTPDAVLAGLEETHPEAFDAHGGAEPVSTCDPYGVLLRSGPSS